MRKLLHWIDVNGLFFASIFLLVFIPLYPKLPLFEAIPGYLVRVRLEDLLVLLIGMLWIVQVWRKKITYSTTFLSLVSAYAGVGLLSIFSGIVLLQTIPLAPLHVGKSLLHFFRYMEYFSVFFFAFAGYNTLSRVRQMLWLLTATVFVVTVYGYGQLHWHWPLFSTMNREFSKGVTLYLTEYARVQSTFAGHYDLAAFLVLVLPLLFAATLMRNRLVERIAFSAAQIAGVWLLVISGSNIALAAYAAGMAAVGILFLYRFPTVFRYCRNISLGVMAAALCISAGIYVSNATLPKQLIQQAEGTPIITQLPGASLALRTARVALYPETAPENSSDRKPADVYHDIPDLVRQATVSASGEESYIIVQKDRTWSDNAIKYGLSMGIRLDTLWPQALYGWARSLYLGSGYATLNKQGAQEFTEADSTDNNYLRTIGETGILGFGVFALIIAMLIAQMLPATTSDNPIVASISIGMIGAVVGLLVNALIIDVFVASKVAFTFWALAGVAVKTIALHQPTQFAKHESMFIGTCKKVLYAHWPLMIGIALALLLLHKNPLDKYSSTRDLSIAPASVESIVAARCWLQQKTWESCTDAVALEHPHSKIYGGLLVLTYSLSDSPSSYFYLNLTLCLIALVLLYRLSVQLLQQPWLRAFVLLLTSSTLFLLQSVSVPVASNSTLPVLLVLLWIVLRWKHKLISVLGAVVGAWMLLPFSVLSLEFSPVALPLIFLLIAVILDRKLPVERFRNKSVLVGIGTAIAVFLCMTGLVSSRWSSQLTEYAGQLQTLRSDSIFRANQFFTGLLTQAEKADLTKRPFVITTIDPLYASLYGNDLYQLLPLSPKQSYFSQLAERGNLHGPNALADFYTQKLAENRVYVLDTNAQTGVFAQDFAQLKKNFTVWQIDSDCDDLCNLYELRTTAPPIPTQPAAINKRELSLDSLPINDFTFITYNHRFNRKQPELVHDITDFVPMVLPLQEHAPDLLMIGGDLSTVSDEGHQEYFLQFAGDRFSVPIIYIPGNYDDVEKKLFATKPQQFRVDNNLFVTLQPSPTGAISLEHKLFLNNILLQLEKQPEITNVFFVSHRMGWVAGNPALEPLSVALNQPLTTEDTFYAEKLLPKLRQFPDKRFYFLGGDLKPNPVVNVFYHTEGNVTYLASAVNNHASDAYLEFRLTPGSTNPTILAKNGMHQPLNEIATYGFEHWRDVAPSLGATAQPQQSSVMVTAIKRISVSLGAGLLAGLIVHWVNRFQIKRLQRSERK